MIVAIIAAVLLEVRYQAVGLGEWWKRLDVVQQQRWLVEGSLLPVTAGWPHGHPAVAVSGTRTPSGRKSHWVATVPWPRDSAREANNVRRRSQNCPWRWRYGKRSRTSINLGFCGICSVVCGYV